MSLGISKLSFIGTLTLLPRKRSCRKRRPFKAVGNALDYAQESMIHMQHKSLEALEVRGMTHRMEG